MARNSFNLKHRLGRLFYQLKQAKFWLGRRWADLRLRKGDAASAEQKRLAGLDHKLVYSMSRSRIPSLRQLKYIETFLSPRERWLWRSATTVFVVSSLFFLGSFSWKHLETVPAQGGSYIEGVVGVPKHVNPLYASVNDVDADLAQLVYSSLYKRDQAGRLVSDLVESQEVGADGKEYTLKIKPNVKWHTGEKLTAGDIVFTFNAIKDQQYKSPLRLSFSGVSVQKLDDQTVKFSLAEAYAGFLDLLTFGIMPEALWYQIPANAASLAELNLKPVGSGPYKFKSLLKDRSGNLKAYHLEPNEDYYGPQAKIGDLQFKFYPSFEELAGAVNDNAVDGASYMPNRLFAEVANKTYLNYYKLSLPQAMAIFFNVRANPALADRKVRQALALAVNRQELIDQALYGNARLIDGPIPADSFAYNPDQRRYGFDPAEAAKLFAEAGWQPVEVSAEQVAQAEKDKSSSDKKVQGAAEAILSVGQGRWLAKNGAYLVIGLTSVDAGDNAQVVEAVKTYWQAAGVKTITALVEPSRIQSDIVRSRNFEALFYGEALGADPDVYPFWHSSQATAQGLNLANYDNKEADKLLEQARLATDQAARAELYRKFQAILAEDVPAIFLYSPVYSYIQNKRVKNMDTTAIVAPSDRLANIGSWYIKTSKKLKW